MIVAPVRCLRQAQRCWKPATLFQSQIHLKISLPSCCRTELGGLSVARRSQHSPVRKGSKIRNYCMRKLGRRDGQYFSYNACSPALGS